MTAAPLDGPGRPTPPTLAIVIVNFNCWPDTGRLVDALTEGMAPGEGRVEILVIDNASAEPPPAGLSGRPGVRVIRRPDNGGFAAGVNTAWRRTAARWLLLLNPDVVAGADFVGAVLARIGHYEARCAGPPGIVGFALRNEDGSPQHSVGSFPTLPRCVLEPFRPRARRKYWPLGRTRPGPVPWVTGACMLVQSRVMEELGGMDEDFFLYHEEVALCRSASDRGWAVEFDDALAPRHLRPLQSRAISPALRVVTRHSKLLYFVKFRPAWEAAALSRIIGLEALVREVAGRIAGRRPEASAWRAVRRIARELVAGRGPRGIEVLAIAERAVGAPISAGGPAGGARDRRTRRPRPIRLDAPRKSR